MPIPERTTEWLLRDTLIYIKKNRSLWQQGNYETCFGGMAVRLHGSDAEQTEFRARCRNAGFGPLSPLIIPQRILGLCDRDALEVFSIKIKSYQDLHAVVERIKNRQGDEQ